jgi:hypothetical protein
MKTATVAGVLSVLAMACGITKPEAPGPNGDAAVLMSLN